MFVETITVPTQEFHAWNERLRLLSDPPAALVASIAWNSGEGRTTGLNVWDSPEAVADFFIERIHPIVEAEGKPATTPIRHGEPVAVYIRQG